MKNFLILFVIIFVGCASVRDREICLDFIPPSERLRKAINEGAWDGRVAEGTGIIPYSGVWFKAEDRGGVVLDIYWFQDSYGRQKWGPIETRGLTWSARLFNSAGGIMNSIGILGGAAIGGYFFKEGMEKRNPDQTNVNMSGGDSSSFSTSSSKLGP